MSLKISWREGSLDFKDFSLILKKKIKRNQIAALQRWLFDI